jgi:archaellum component FlaF (FlaF/FlaG flagellin family)
MSAIHQIDKINSAEAMNKNTQSIYVNDLVYVVCKVFLFVILGIVYVVFFKNPENMKNVLMEAKDNIVEKIKAVKNKAIEVKAEAKAEAKPATNVKPEVKTNANTNKNPTA